MLFVGLYLCFNHLNLYLNYMYGINKNVNAPGKSKHLVIVTFLRLMTEKHEGVFCLYFYSPSLLPAHIN